MALTHAVRQTLQEELSTTGDTHKAYRKPKGTETSMQINNYTSSASEVTCSLL